MALDHSTRRRWMRQLMGGAAAFAGLGEAAAGSDPAQPAQGDGGGQGHASMILRSSRPIDLETPVEAFRQWATPNDLFFVRAHLGEPATSLHPSTLAIGGAVGRPLNLEPNQLREFEQVEVPAVLQCSGNGRANFRPRVPGVPWDRGAVGNAVWKGVRLADLLKRAGLQLETGHVHFLGADAPPHPKTPAYLRSLPLEKALDPSTLIATTMNGDPLPYLHGGPLRLIVPGWLGNHWMKWLRQIVVARDEAPGPYMQSSYRMPRRPLPPGVEPRAGELEMITWLNVKSLIAAPAAGQRLERGSVEIQGVAWTGQGHVARVEVATEPGGTWHPARLEGDERPYTWRIWRFAWNAEKPGRYTLRARATDSRGNIQPERPPWNKSGYLWNGIDTVECTVV